MAVKLPFLNSDLIFICLRLEICDGAERELYLVENALYVRITVHVVVTNHF